MVGRWSWGEGRIGAAGAVCLPDGDVEELNALAEGGDLGVELFEAVFGDVLDGRHRAALGLIECGAIGVEVFVVELVEDG